MMVNLQNIVYLTSILFIVSGEEGVFLHVTDFHWDFTYGGGDWSCTNDVSNHGIYGDYWCDSPWRLISDSVEAMKNFNNAPDFILWTGCGQVNCFLIPEGGERRIEYITTLYRDKFHPSIKYLRPPRRGLPSCKYLTQGDSVLHNADDHLTLETSDSTLGNLTKLLRCHFPTTPVYATYGNHDYYPNGQFPPHNNELYNLTLEQWRSWINDVNQEDNFRKGGYYTLTRENGIRILALNTNLYYTSDKVTATLVDPSDQFKWMEVVLLEARTNKEKVIVTGHVPPGIAAPETTRWMYEHYNKKLVEILLKYSDVIVGMHFGHEHTDNFRVLYDDSGVPKISLFLAPSVTPWRYKSSSPAHNPGFRLIKYDRTNGQHLDMVQYYMDLTESNRQNQSNWKIEYTATTDMNIPDLSPSSMDKYIRKMRNHSSPEFKDHFKWRTVSVNHSLAMSCDESCHASIYCNFQNLQLSKFQDCTNVLTSSGYSPYSTLFQFVCLICVLFFYM